MSQDPLRRIFAPPPPIAVPAWMISTLPVCATETRKDAPMNDPEVNAIDDALSALEDLDYEAKIRAFRYLIARLGVPLGELSR
jgi:hypothetical protein